MCISSLCQRKCALAYVTWLPGSRPQETRVSVNAEACQRQVPALPPMPAIQQLGKDCKAHGQVWAIGKQHQLEFPVSGGWDGQASPAVLWLKVETFCMRLCMHLLQPLGLTYILYVLLPLRLCGKEFSGSIYTLYKHPIWSTVALCSLTENQTPNGMRWAVGLSAVLQILRWATDLHTCCHYITVDLRPQRACHGFQW